MVLVLTGSIHFPVRGEAHEALLKDLRFAGIPETLVTDGAKEETLGEWKKTCRNYRVTQEVTLPYSP